MDPNAAAIFRERGIEVDENHRPVARRARRRSSATMTASRSARSTKVTARRCSTPPTAPEGRRPRRDRRRQCRHPRRHRARRRRDEHAVRQFDHHRRACHRADVRARPRRLPEADASTQAGKWEKNRFMGVEVTGKTLGLIGAGNIGSIVADRALGPQDEGRRLRPVPDPRARGRAGRRQGRARRAACAAPTSSRCTRR